MPDEKDKTIIMIDVKSVEGNLVKAVLDSLDEADRLGFMISQLQTMTVNHNKTPEIFIERCEKADKCVRFKVPPEFAHTLYSLCALQSKEKPEIMMTRVLANLIVLGMEHFTGFLIDERFVEMHKRVSASIGGIFDSYLQGEKD